MDIRGALGEGVDQDLVDVADDGRIVGLAAAYVGTALLVASLDHIEVVEIGIVDRQGHRRIVGGARGALHHLDELVLLDDHRLGGETGSKLDLVECGDVGGVCEADEQLFATLVQRQRRVLAKELLADIPDQLAIDLDGRDIEYRRAELEAGDFGHAQSGSMVALDHHGDEVFPLLVRLLL